MRRIVALLPLALVLGCGDADDGGEPLDLDTFEAEYVALRCAFEASCIPAVSPSEETCRRLLFTWGVLPVCFAEHPGDWSPVIRESLQKQGVPPGMVILTEGPSKANPTANHRMEVLDFRSGW